MTVWEVFALCRRCSKPTIFEVELIVYDLKAELEGDAVWSSNANLNAAVRVLGYVGLRENVSRRAPDHVPAEIKSAFEEGAVCLSVRCFNAASTMFRLCLDLATRELLPAVPPVGAPIPEGEPNRRQRRDLGLRIPWLIETGRLPAEFGQLADVVREDGNDGAHVGNLSEEDAEDIADFTEVLLDRLFTEPAKVQLAAARRLQRRGGEEAVAETGVE